MQGLQVWFLVGELRSHMPLPEKPKEKNKKLWVQKEELEAGPKTQNGVTSWRWDIWAPVAEPLEIPQLQCGSWFSVDEIFL